MAAPRAACRDRTLAGRRGDADEILRRVLDVGEVRERAFADDDDFRAQHERITSCNEVVFPAVTTRSLWVTVAKLMRRIDN